MSKRHSLRITCTVSPSFVWCKKPESLSVIQFQPLNYRLPVRCLDTDGALKCVLKKRKEILYYIIMSTQLTNALQRDKRTSD